MKYLQLGVDEARIVARQTSRARHGAYLTLTPGAVITVLVDDLLDRAVKHFQASSCYFRPSTSTRLARAAYVLDIPPTVIPGVRPWLQAEPSFS